MSLLWAVAEGVRVWLLLQSEAAVANKLYAAGLPLSSFEKRRQSDNLESGEGTVAPLQSGCPHPPSWIQALELDHLSLVIDIRPTLLQPRAVRCAAAAAGVRSYAAKQQ